VIGSHSDIFIKFENSLDGQKISYSKIQHGKQKIYQAPNTIYGIGF